MIKPYQPYKNQKQSNNKYTKIQIPFTDNDNILKATCQNQEQFKHIEDNSIIFKNIKNLQSVEIS